MVFVFLKLVDYSMTDRTSQSSFIESLLRIDPTEGFVQYIQATKPYHTKILDVLVEYIFAEDINVTITDRISWVMQFSRPEVDTVYSCGYGFVWDPLLLPTTPDNPLSPLLILEATDAIDSPLPGSENSNSFLIQSAAYVPFVVASAGTSNNQLIFSKNYDVLNKDNGTNEWEVDDPSNALVTELTTGLLPKIIYISSDTGLVGNGQYTVTGTPTHPVGRQDIIVAPATLGAFASSIAAATYDFDVTIDGGGLQQLSVVLTGGETYAAIATLMDTQVIGGSTAYDDTLSALVVTSNAPGVGGSVLVAAGTAGSGGGDLFIALAAADTKTFTPSTPILGTNVTSVKVVEIIPTQANGDGVFHRVLETGELPQWPASQAVTLTATTGTLPQPIVDGTRYYFQPTPTAGYFNLSYVRYPNAFNDFVDITTLGSGEFTIIRDESLIPGAGFSVTDSYLLRNNGQYIAKMVEPEGVDERVFVYQKVQAATPFAFIGGDGIIQVSADGFDQPGYCPPSQMSDLHADAYIHENLKFTFELNFSDAISSSLAENAAKGFGETFFGDALLGSYGTYADSFDSRTAQTSGLPGGDSAHTILPTGYDTQLFDVGGLDETLQTVRHFYGRYGL